MVKITLKLLNSHQILLNGDPVNLPFKKAEALLFYIGIKKTVSREEVASLLWDSSDELTAKKNLRHTLYTIKKAFAAEPIISLQRQILTLNPEIEFDIDYDHFLNENQLELYNTELLHGFFLKNASEFENWLSIERSSLHNTYLRKLYDTLENTPTDKIAVIEQLFSDYTKVDPLDERVYYLMMMVYKENALYHKGVKIYEQLSKKLNAELGITPSKELGELRRDLLKTWTESTVLDQEPEKACVQCRENEISFLTKKYYHFLFGNPSAILLLGENGVGKTYLMNRFLDNLGNDSSIVLKAMCFQVEKDFPFQPWNTIMLQLDHYISQNNIKIPKQYSNILATLFPILGQQGVSPGLPEDLNISYNYRATCNSILKILSLVSDELPIVLAFDNIQFMDQFSLELFSLIIREQSPNIMVIGTCLDILKSDIKTYVHSLTREHLLTQLLVKPFSKEATALFIKTHLGKNAVSPEVIEKIYNETEGNAFFLEILLNDFSNHNYENVLSIKTQDILMDRISGLSLESRQLLDVISLFHDYASLEILEYILNWDTLIIIDQIEDLKQQGLILEGVTKGIIQFKFRHNKMQEFVHSQLSPSKRRLLHSRVATYLEQTPALKTSTWYQKLIYHYTLCGNEPKVLHNRILALEECSCNSFELYPVLNPLVTLNPSSEVSIPKTFEKLRASLSQLYYSQPNRIDYAETEAHLLHTIGKYYISQGNYEQGIPAIKQALNNSYVQNDPYYQILCYRQISYYGIQIWDTDIMKENIEKNMTIASIHKLNIQYAIECRLYGLYFSMLENFEEARNYQSKSIDILKTSSLHEKSLALNIAACYNYLGEIERKQIHFEESLDYYDEAIKICLSKKCPVSPTFYTNKARSLLSLNRLHESEKVLSIANTLYDDTSTLMRRSIAKGYYALLHARKGNFKYAIELLKETIACAPLLSSPVEEGLLAGISATLLTEFPDVFKDILPKTINDYVDQAFFHLSDLSCKDDLNQILKLRTN